MSDTSQGGTIEGNAADDALMVNQGVARSVDKGYRICLVISEDFFPGTGAPGPRIEKVEV